MADFKCEVTYTVNPRLKPWGLINFMVHNHPGSNRDRVEFETLKKIKLFNLDR